MSFVEGLTLRAPSVSMGKGILIRDSTSIQLENYTSKFLTCFIHR